MNRLTTIFVLLLAGCTSGCKSGGSNILEAPPTLLIQNATTNDLSVLMPPETPVAVQDTLVQRAAAHKTKSSLTPTAQGPAPTNLVIITEWNYDFSIISSQNLEVPVTNWQTRFKTNFHFSVTNIFPTTNNQEFFGWKEDAIKG